MLKLTLARLGASPSVFLSLSFSNIMPSLQDFLSAYETFLKKARDATETDGMVDNSDELEAELVRYLPNITHTTHYSIT